MTIDDTDPNTHTLAAAWASSPLGQPEREVRYGFATVGPTEAVASDDPQPVAKRAILAAALASGVIGGAALGVMLFDYTTQPTVVVPGSEAGQTAPEAPSSSRLPGPPRALPTETRPAPDNAPGPNPVVSVPGSAAGGQQGPADITVQGDTTVVVDVPIPDYPPLPDKPDQQEPEPPEPQDPDPEPPKPEPPVLGDPNFKVPDLPPDPPKPEPKPDPPEFLPDLPLAPLPDPDPTIKLPLIPSPKLNPQPEPPSLPNFVPPAGFGS